MGLIENTHHQRNACSTIIKRGVYFHIIPHKFYDDGTRSDSAPVSNIKEDESDSNIAICIIDSLENSGGIFISDGEKEVKNFLSIKTKKELFNGSYYFNICYAFNTKTIKITKWEKDGRGFSYSDIEERIILGDDPSVITKSLRKMIEETSPICY